MKSENESLQKAFSEKPWLAALVFGLAMFVFLSVCFVMFFETFWGLMKDNNPLSYLLPPLFILQLPGFLLAGALLPIGQRGFESVQLWLLSSFLSAIFWALAVYFVVWLQKRWKKKT